MLVCLQALYSICLDMYWAYIMWSEELASVFAIQTTTMYGAQKKGPNAV